MGDILQGPRIDVAFPGGKKVTAAIHGHTVPTDQPVKSGGEGSAPSPLDLFFVSLATCAGFYVLEFCAGRGIPLDGVSLSQTFTRDAATKRVLGIELAIHVPPSFPEKYRAAVVQAANSCAVKKVLEHPPQLTTQVVID
jgi:putative redox protein